MLGLISSGLGNKPKRPPDVTDINGEEGRMREKGGHCEGRGQLRCRLENLYFAYIYSLNIPCCRRDGTTEDPRM